IGVGPEAVIGICMERSLDLIVGLMGILKAGGAYMALDPEYPRERLAYMVDDAKSPIVLTQERLVEKLRWLTTKVIRVDTDWGTIEREDRGNQASGVTADNLA